MRDLILLVPDKNTEYTVRGALSRPEALGIRQIDFQVIVDQGRDGGVRRRGSQVLGVQQARFSHALLLLDYEGCGSDVAPVELEAQLDNALSGMWGDRAKAIVIDPEVDVWMWGAETHLRSMVDWRFPEGIRPWLVSQSFAFTADGKPERPKEALEAAFRRAQTPRSSARYEQVAQSISLTRCRDEAFLRLRASVVGWFGAPQLTAH
ncbi:MAG: methylation-associated defense system protein MAD4 [Acidobacteriota bacterium]